LKYTYFNLSFPVFGRDLFISRFCQQLLKKSADGFVIVIEDENALGVFGIG